MLRAMQRRSPRSGKLLNTKYEIEWNGSISGPPLPQIKELSKLLFFLVLGLHVLNLFLIYSRKNNNKAVSLL